MLGLLFDSEDENSAFLRNVDGLLPQALLAAWFLLVSHLFYPSMLEMETVYSPKFRLVPTRIHRVTTPEESCLHSHFYEDLKSNRTICVVYIRSLLFINPHKMEMVLEKEGETFSSYFFMRDKERQKALTYCPLRTLASFTTDDHSSITSALYIQHQTF